MIKVLTSHNTFSMILSFPNKYQEFYYTKHNSSCQCLSTCDMRMKEPHLRSDFPFAKFEMQCHVPCYYGNKVICILFCDYCNKGYLKVQHQLANLKHYEHE